MKGSLLLLLVATLVSGLFESYQRHASLASSELHWTVANDTLSMAVSADCGEKCWVCVLLSDNEHVGDTVCAYRNSR